MNQRTMRIVHILPVLAASMLLSCSKRDCGDEAGNVTTAERAWIAYAPGEHVLFTNALGDTSELIAGSIEDRAHYGGGSKGDCMKNFHSLHQPLSGLSLPASAELMVVHDRETGNASGYVADYHLTSAPANGIVVNGATYNEVYFTFDSTYCFNKTYGVLKAGEWLKLP